MRSTKFISRLGICTFLLCISPTVASATDYPVLNSPTVIGGVQYIVWADSIDSDTSVKVTSGYSCSTTFGNCQIVSITNYTDHTKGVAKLLDFGSARNINISINHIQRYLQDNHLETLTSVLHLRSDLIVNPLVNILFESVNEGIGSSAIRVRLTDTRTSTSEPLENFPTSYFEGYVLEDGSTGDIPSTEYLSTFGEPTQVSETSTQTIGQVYSPTRLETFTAQIGKLIKINNHEYAADVVTLGPFIATPRATIPRIGQVISKKDGCLFTVSNFDSNFTYIVNGAIDWTSDSLGNFKVLNLLPGESVELSLGTSRLDHITYNGFYTGINCLALPDSDALAKAAQERANAILAKAQADLFDKMAQNINVTNAYLSAAGYPSLESRTLEWLNEEIKKDSVKRNQKDSQLLIQRAIQYDKIETSAKLALSGKVLEELKIISNGYPRQTIASELAALPLSARDTIEEISKYLENWIHKYQVRQVRLNAIRK
jgi:hypothetical protein